MNSPLKTLAWVAVLAYTIWFCGTVFNSFTAPPWTTSQFTGDPEIASAPEEYHAKRNLFDRFVRVGAFLLIGAVTWCLTHSLLPAARENQAQRRSVLLVCGSLVMLSVLVAAVIGWRHEQVNDAHVIDAEEEPTLDATDYSDWPTEYTKGFGDVD